MLGAAIGSGLVTVTVAAVVPDPPVLGGAELAGLLVVAALTMRFALGWWAAVQAAAVGAATLAGGLLRDTPGMGAATDLAYLALALGGRRVWAYGSAPQTATAAAWWRPHARPNG